MVLPAAMTPASTFDIAWVRPGRERSGTAKNLLRRAAQATPWSASSRDRQTPSATITHFEIRGL
jgi:hypothetical protein